MTDHLTNLELDTLRLVAGRPQTRVTGWGSALAAAAGGLRGRGLARWAPAADGGYSLVPTDAGIALLDKMDGEP